MLNETLAEQKKFRGLGPGFGASSERPKTPGGPFVMITGGEKDHLNYHFVVFICNTFLICLNRHTLIGT